ncbi:MAG: hypothetical protein BMS9Abin09_0317 [Gammaproteobacteria bacterium]|nr:MAG: hypothetical protein BMS9Abin09_0317 [Gammaproteobacteria bacterium]
MNVLLVAPQPFYVDRGTPIAVRLLAETLCQMGHKVDLLTYHEGNDIEYPGLRLLRISAPPGIHDVPIGFSPKKLVCDLFLSWSLWRAMAAKRYEVIHAVEESVFPALLFRSSKHSRVIYDMDSSMADQLIEKWPGLKRIARLLHGFEKFAVRRSDLVMPVCEHLAEKVRAFDVSKPVFVVEDVPLESDGAGEPVENLRQVFDINEILALYVGNLEHYQGIDLLLESLALLEGPAAMRMVIIGGSDAAISAYEERCRQLGVADRVVFTGSRPVGHLADYLQQADILLSPRACGENTPMKIYSYMAVGKAVLATDIGSHRQALDDSSALLVAPDAHAFASGLDQLVGDAALRQRLGDGAMARVEKHYSRAAYRKKIGIVYAAVEDNKGQSA